MHVRLLQSIHDQVYRRRRWCAEVHGSYNLNGFDPDEYATRDPGIVSDSSSDDDDVTDDDIGSDSYVSDVSSSSDD